MALLAGSLAERARRGEVRLEQATEEIADLQAFNQYVLDNLVSGLATADADNRLLTFNRSAMAIAGLDGALPLGRPAAEVLQLTDAVRRDGSGEDLSRGSQQADRLPVPPPRRHGDRHRPERGRAAAPRRHRAGTSTRSRT